MPMRGRALRGAASAIVVTCMGGTLASARGPAPGPAAPPGPAVDFARDIQPILAASCVRCHGPRKTEGDLRLDTPEGLHKAGDSGAVVVAGDAKGSLLYQLLIATDPDKRMPRRRRALAPAQIEAVQRWIDQGAPWPEGAVVQALTPAPEDRATRPAGAATGISFNRDVRPILAENCYACHGPDRNRRQKELRLDLEEVATGPLPSGHVAIVPGHPETSALLQRVTDPDELRRMPHVSSGKPRLSTTQIETLRRWIEQGAQWEPHWSYTPPKRPELPTVKDAKWPRNPVDRFILARLEREGLSPSPEAAKTTLVRRVTLDLTGLPPTPEE